jgi:serine/threonine protein kinase
LQVASGLAAAHAQGVIHRDVKPANILLEDSVDRVVISDFGLARTVDDATLTHTGVVAGTPHYMSPEQAMGGTVDPRSDLFSLGSVIYFMCTGRPPYRATNAMGILNRICHEPHRAVDEVNPDVPAELGDIVDCLLEKESRRRFANGTEVYDRLAALLVALQQGGRHPRRRRWRSWKRMALPLANSLPAVAVGVSSMLLGMLMTRWFWQAAPATQAPSVTANQTEPTVDDRDQNSARQSPADLLESLLPDTFPQELSSTKSGLAELETRWRMEPVTAEPIVLDQWQQDLGQLRSAVEETVKAQRRPGAEHGTSQ